MTERISITLTTENAAFSDEPATEIARILRAQADLIASGMAAHETPLRDLNGNRVGECIITSETAPQVEDEDEDEPRRYRVPCKFDCTSSAMGHVIVLAQSEAEARKEFLAGQHEESVIDWDTEEVDLTQARIESGDLDNIEREA